LLSLAFPLLALLTAVGAASAQPVSDPKVIVVTLDGMRWQEVFGGMDSALGFGAAGGAQDTAHLRERFWKPTAAERRAALLPFFWREVAPRGQVFGDSLAGSVVRVTNGRRFSYPGYNELFSGAPDDRIDSNDKVPNPNVTVLEWLNGRDAFRGRIAAFGSWDVFPFIFNAERSGIPVTALGPPFPGTSRAVEQLINDVAGDLPRLWSGAALDAPAIQAALETLRSRRPRVLVLLLGETDEWAHARRYDLYLDAARRADRAIERLWKTAQSLAEYRDRVSLLIATDHGRGRSDDWTDHGRDVPAADRIWMAVMGPRTPALGVRAGVSGTQAQVAATIAALLGEDWQSARPGVAPPLAGAIR
jgi:hypothetical protein